ncbi:hypothetical protein [Cognatishimia maritima]|uniref:Type IV pilus biogenesis protein PilP n=1 Tax=Cognatishimia maritima TaxID=870908 RepID=A0A1M5V342_9RHOB|nr:hypothetical protein [Cognatishimia maritima]SHH69635.1 hypothetical protein SAMN04488044_3063 [Cognatishimia maritima]
MKPDFALSLSFEGIRFLCRVDAGWHNLGEVPLEHVDLEAALAKLRGLGEDQADGQALCKIVLPNDQIKYIALAGLKSDQDEEIAAAVAEATPYTLDELAYDFVETEDGVDVAIVARETLAEAESFALEHGFSPVCFVAQPTADQFNAEPFFGLTQEAAKLVDDPKVITPDDAPIEVVSSGPLPDPVDDPPPPFSSSRLSTSATEGAAGKLGGATRTQSATGAPAVSGQSATETGLEPASALSAQEPRFDTATLIAGLKKRPEPVTNTRPRGAARVGGAEKPPTSTVVAEVAGSADATASIQTIQAQPAEGGKPRYLGVILIVILLVFLAAVALWSSMTSEDGLAGLWGAGNNVETIELLPETDNTFETTALPPVSEESVTDSAEIEALDDNEGVLIDPVMEAALPSPTSETIYAATGIWDRAPAQPIAPQEDVSENSEAIYLASFEPVQQTHDAIALPSADSFTIDPDVARQNNPVAAGTTIDLDERGLVVATAEGAISPEGILVYLGKPASLPPSFPDRTQIQEEAQEEMAAEVDAELARLAAFRPKARPSDLIEQNERATLGGSTRLELAGIRPKLRPEGLVQVVSIDPNAIALATDQAVMASIRPQVRPSDFASTVRAQKEQLASVAVPRSETVQPSIPTTASVARNATQENAINLRKVNLIGVYGASNDRRALVRLSSGRYKKVQIGDRIDGGRVAAINTTELHYVKGGRTIVLKMPRG